MKLPPDIAAQVEKDFGPDAAAVMTLLDSYRDAIPEPARVIRCMIYLAERDSTRMAGLVKMARADYRDVILGAEYVDHAGERPKQVRDFSKPFLHHEPKAPKRSKKPTGERLPPDVKRLSRHKKK